MSPSICSSAPYRQIGIEEEETTESASPVAGPGYHLPSLPYELTLVPPDDRVEKDDEALDQTHLGGVVHKPRLGAKTRPSRQRTWVPSQEYAHHST